MRNDYGLFPPDRRDGSVILFAALAGMVAGAALALAGAWALAVLLLSFERLIP